MTASMLSVKLQTFDAEGVVMLKVQGPLDGHTYSTLESRIDRLIYHGAPKIIIDLSEVEFISSAGVQVLVAGRTKARHDQGDIVLLGVSEAFVHTLDLLKIHEMLRIAKDLPEALQLLSK